MTTYRLPLPVATRSSPWRRLVDAVIERLAAWRARRPAARPDVVEDWLPLRDLPESIQRDIGVPAALREHGAALRERDALWLHV